MLLPLSTDLAPPSTVPLTVHLPRPLWDALQVCAPDGGEVNAVICEAVEAHVARTMAQRRKKGKGARLVATLSQPITALGLSGRAQGALLRGNVQHVHDLVRKTRLDISRVPGIDPKCLREIEDKLTSLGLNLGMPLDAATYRAAVIQAHLADHRASAGGKEG